MVSAEQQQRALDFLSLHHAHEPLVLLNSWDVGSSKLVEACGYKAIATTSMGIAASMGYADCEIILLDELLDVVRRIVAAVRVPVTVDVETGFGATTYEILNSMRRVIDSGAVGINIEDSVQLQPQLIDVELQCERIAAIRALAASEGLSLVINARTDSFYTGKGTDEEKLRESIYRGNCYHEAGADCVFVQPVWDRNMITTLVKEIDAPLNILVNPALANGVPPSISELAALGVARISLGSSMMKATLSLMKKIADELLTDGSYNTLLETITPLTNANAAYVMAIRRS